MTNEKTGNILGKIDWFIYKYRVMMTIYFSILGLILFIDYYKDKKIDFDTSSVKMFVVLSIVLLFIILLKTMIKKEIIFEDNEITICTKIFNKTIKKIKYSYDSIFKFLIGGFYKKGDIGKYYSIYIDVNNKMVKIKSLRTYKECIEIMEQIKTKAKKMICDETDTNYYIEEDLFMNYYKMKKLINEIKNEDIK
ncbi:hypothetical protein FACS189476_00620 [Spirochaetia bacterium]|nr:hypothetical protein FACS189476_00620 [Spirochaetia bacterium]